MIDPLIDPLHFFQNLGFALLLGMLIGIEREQKSQKQDRSSFGGVRTMSLVGMLGYLVYTMFGDNPLMFAIFTTTFLTLVVAAYVISSVMSKDYGATSEIATFFVYLAGLLVGMGETLLATVITLTVLLLLYFKKPLHTFVKRVEKEEIYDTIKFIVVAFVVLPLLPNDFFGPLSVLNPYQIWLVVVLVSSISFVSYAAIKIIGPKKGIGLSGFLGGLISSTAVSMSLSSLSKKAKTVTNPFIFGIVIASTAMFFRVLVEVAALNSSLLQTLVIPMGAMGLVGIFVSAYYWFRKQEGHETKHVSDKDLNFKTPFQLWPAVQFGIFFALLLFVSKFASINYGDEGLYITAFLSGFVDVDAITVSMANLSASNDITNSAAVTAITIATMTNTFVKGLIVFLFGSPMVGRRVFSAMALIILVGLVSLLFFVPDLNGAQAFFNGSIGF